jgi:hypothetical protein
MTGARDGSDAEKELEASINKVATARDYQDFCCKMLRIMEDHWHRKSLFETSLFSLQINSVNSRYESNTIVFLAHPAHMQFPRDGKPS